MNSIIRIIAKTIPVLAIFSIYFLGYSAIIQIIEPKKSTTTALVILLTGSLVINTVTMHMYKTYAYHQLNYLLTKSPDKDKFRQLVRDILAITTRIDDTPELSILLPMHAFLRQSMECEGDLMQVVHP